MGIPSLNSAIFIVLVYIFFDIMQIYEIHLTHGHKIGHFCGQAGIFWRVGHK